MRLDQFDMFVQAVSFLVQSKKDRYVDIAEELLDVLGVSYPDDNKRNQIRAERAQFIQENFNIDDD